MKPVILRSRCYDLLSLFAEPISAGNDIHVIELGPVVNESAVHDQRQDTKMVGWKKWVEDNLLSPFQGTRSCRLQGLEREVGDGKGVEI